MHKVNILLQEPAEVRTPRWPVRASLCNWCGLATPRVSASHSAMCCLQEFVPRGSWPFGQTTRQCADKSLTSSNLRFSNPSWITRRSNWFHSLHIQTTAKPIPILAYLDYASSTPSQTPYLGLLAVPRRILDRPRYTFLLFMFFFAISPLVCPMDDGSF